MINKTNVISSCTHQEGFKSLNIYLFELKRILGVKILDVANACNFKVWRMKQK